MYEPQKAQNKSQISISQIIDQQNQISNPIEGNEITNSSQKFKEQLLKNALYQKQSKLQLQKIQEQFQQQLY